MTSQSDNISTRSTAASFLSEYARKIAGIPNAVVKSFRDWKFRNRPVMPGYSGTNIWRHYRIFWFLLFCAWCVFYGMLVGVFGSFYVISMTFPIIFLLPIAIWVMPETGRPPIVLVEVLFFMFMAALMIWPDYLAIAIPGLPWITALRIFGVALAIAFLVSLSVSKDLRKEMMQLLNTAPVLWKLIVAYAALTCFSIFYSTSPAFSLNKFVVAQVNWTLIFFASVYVFSKPGRLVVFVYLFFAMAIANSAIALWEWYLQRLPWVGHIPSFLKIDDEAVQRILSPRSRATTGIYRVQSVFSTPLGLAEYLAYVTPFAMHLVMTAKKFPMRVLALLILPLMFYVILKTDSRLGMVGFFLTGLIYVFIWSWQRWLRDRWSIFGPAILMGYPVFAVGFFAATFFVGRLRNIIWGTGAHQSSNDTRQAMYIQGFENIVERPWGYGLGRAAEELGFVNGNGVLTIDTYYIAVALDTGIIGFFVYYAAVIAAIIYCLKLLAKSDIFENMLIAPIMICMVNFLVIKSVFSQIGAHSLIYALMGAVVALTARFKLDLHQKDIDSRGAAMVPEYLRLAEWKYKTKEL